jgi:hypothetical protein
MMDWLFFIIPPLVIIAVAVLYQLQKTRNAMVEFARRHGMGYQKQGKNPFGIGEIKGRIGVSSFFLGLMPSSYGSGTKAKQKYPEVKRFYMHIGVEKMPEKLGVWRRQTDQIGHFIEDLSDKAGLPLKTDLPLVKTEDEVFDNEFEVIGNQEETLPWLTEQRRAVIAAFLSVANSAVSRGGVGYCFTKTKVSFNEFEEAFSRLTSAKQGLESQF